MGPVAVCPLCGQVDRKSLSPESPADTVAALHARSNTGAIPEVLASTILRLAGSEVARCLSCGLDWFPGSSAGDESFYSELTESLDYYEPVRWEFSEVAARCEGNCAVIDLGCGRGAFLSGLSVGRRVGVDHNPLVSGALEDRGIEHFEGSFHEASEAMPEEFDVVTCFHVLEHVERVADIVEPAVALLKPGGRLYLSVPNRERDVRSGIDPLDRPPHHLSRWSAAQFSELADRYGLRLDAVAVHPPDVSWISWKARTVVEEDLKRRGLNVSAGSMAGRLAGRMARLIPPLRTAVARSIQGPVLLASLERPSD